MTEQANKAPRFQIQQIALCPPNPAAAIALLTELGLEDWARDIVTAHGQVYGEDESASQAELNFNYQVGGSDPEANKPLELEVLHYLHGKNWMDAHTPRVSHLGMHCTEDELLQFIAIFNLRGIDIAQELYTDTHTNPHIAGKRTYHYVIFDTYDILGVDLKFIVRHDVGANCDVAAV